MHADSGERGEHVKKKGVLDRERVQDRETCNGELGGSPGRRGSLWCTVYRVRAGAAPMVEGWVPGASVQAGAAAEFAENLCDGAREWMPSRDTETWLRRLSWYVYKYRAVLGPGEVTCSRPRTGQARKGLGTEFCLLTILLLTVEKFQIHPKVVGNANEHLFYTSHLASIIITIVNVI